MAQRSATGQSETANHQDFPPAGAVAEPDHRTRNAATFSMKPDRWDVFQMPGSNHFDPRALRTIREKYRERATIGDMSQASRCSRSMTKAMPGAPFGLTVSVRT